MTPLAIYRPRTRSILLAAIDGQHVDLAEADALALAESIRGAFAVPAHAAELAAPRHLARWPRGMRGVKLLPTIRRLGHLMSDGLDEDATGWLIEIEWRGRIVQLASLRRGPRR